MSLQFEELPKGRERSAEQGENPFELKLGGGRGYTLFLSHESGGKRGHREKGGGRQEEHSKMGKKSL